LPNLYPYLPEDWDERMEEQAYAYLLYHGASAWCPVTMEWATARDYESSWYQDLTAQGYRFLNQDAEALYGVYETDRAFTAMLTDDTGALYGSYFDDQAGAERYGVILRDGRTGVLAETWEELLERLQATAAADIFAASAPGALHAQTAESRAQAEQARSDA